MNSGGLRVRVRVLGPLEVLDADGRGHDVPGARLATLLVRLALEDGRPVPTRTLIADLWDDAPAGELNALQSLISRLRRALGGTGSITQAAGGYRLALADDGLDVARFRRLAGEGRARLRAGDDEAARRVLAEALALWRGPVAAEVEEVAPGLGATLEGQRIEAVADRTEVEIRLGSGADCLEELALLRARHPQHERLAALEIRALTDVGRVADALATFNRFRRDLADRLGIDPGPILQEAYQAALGADAGPSRRPTESAANLPTAVTSFLGRHAELDQVAQLLQNGRLVTILGPGGAGKTRLALETGRRLHRQSSADVWLVELAGVTDEADVPQAVLAALGLREAAMLDSRTSVRPARETLDLLVDRFGGRPTVLLLDNCEHVIGAAAALADAALAACPSLRIVATSREPLAIDGEFLLPLAPLTVPAAGLAADQVDRLPAVELFADRGRAARPDFRLDEATRPAVGEIVRRLDGLPLAIELAAARLRTLPVAEIADRLSDRFRLLTSGSRTADARHRTLRSVVAWSWELLDPDERLLAERVSVFPAGLTRDSAVAVCAEPTLGVSETGIRAALDADAVPELLDALVEKSLLQLNPSGQRYRVLETIREYGQERLIERGELHAVRLAAARHFAALVAEADPRLRTSEQVQWLGRLRAEHDNVVAALRAFCDAGDADAALTLTLDFGWYWFLLGRYLEATGWAATVLAIPGAADPDLTRDVRVIAALGRIAGATWGLDQSTEPDFADIVQELQAAPTSTRPLIRLFLPIVLFVAQADEAGRQLLDAVDAVVADDDPWLSAAGRLMRARFAENVGDLDTAREDSERALATFRTLGDQWGIAAALPIVGLLRVYDSDLDGALEAFQEAQSASRLFGSQDIDDSLFLTLRLADVRMRRGEHDEARAVIENARHVVDGAAQAESLVIFFALAAMTERFLGDHAKARELQRQSGQALAQVRTGPLVAGHGAAVVHASAGTLEIDSGALDSAAQQLSEAYAAGVRSRDHGILALVGIVVADLALALGRYRDAAEILGASAKLRGADDPTQVDIRRIRSAAVRALGAETAADADAEGRALDTAAATARLDPALLKEPAAAGTASAGTGSSGQALRL